MTERGQIRFLGSFRRFNLRRSIERKIHALLRDETGLPRPLFISLIIPTKIDVGSETRQFETRALRRVLSECSSLVDLGYLDELIVIDGSRDEEGNADYTTLQNVVKLAYNSMDLFRAQVDMINNYFAERVKASRGFFDFIVKVIHQFDRNIFNVLTTYGVHKISGLNRMPPGKGAALWLSIPIATGDIICFIDSDIMNFQKKYVVALCDPIIRSWRSDTPIKIVKASYKRLTYSFEIDKLRLGGRVTRLFMRPLLKVLDRKYPDLFGGLKDLKYPLSGEQSMRRDLIEKISFPNNYAIEISILVQLKKLSELLSMKQVDLDWLQHVGQPDKELTDIVEQITRRIISILKENGIHLTDRDMNELITRYKREVRRMMPYYERVFHRVKEKAAYFFEEDLYYSEDFDKRSLDLFLKSFEETLRSYERYESTLLLPPWSEVRERVNYHAVKQLLGIRSNQSTQSRLRETGLIS